MLTPRCDPAGTVNTLTNRVRLHRHGAIQICKVKRVTSKAIFRALASFPTTQSRATRVSNVAHGNDGIIHFEMFDITKQALIEAYHARCAAVGELIWPGIAAGVDIGIDGRSQALVSWCA